MAVFWWFVYRVIAYFPLLMTEKWPPEKDHPLEYPIDYPEHLNPAVLILLKLPSFILGIIQALISIALLFLFGNGFVTALCILFTEKYPKSLFKVNRNIMTWTAQTQAWQWLMRDDAKLFGTTLAVKISLWIGIVGYILLLLTGNSPWHWLGVDLIAIVLP